MISLTETLRQIADGRLTPQTAIDRSLSAISETDPALRAFVRFDPAAKAGTGPLAGVAVGVKDIFDTADFATEMGSAIYAGWRPKADAPIVAELKRLGATAVGKTVTTPFASMDPAETRNPRNPAHTPGGSSSGSAAAVAAGMVPLALGTQTGGSVIRPASFCGVAAIKPSYRLLPTEGVKCFAWSLDTVGLFAAGVADVAQALALITGRPDLTATGATPRVGVITQDFAGPPEAEGARALETAIAALERAGATVRALSAPAEFAAMWHAHPTLQAYEASRSLCWELMSYGQILTPKVKGELEHGRTLSTGHYDSVQATARAARAAAGKLFEQADVVISLSAPGPAPETLATTGDPRFNRLWTDLGTPAVNVPVYLAPGNLPVGVQVIAPYGQDGKALAAARFLERAVGRVVP
ncbi:MAG: amidase [Rhodospirillaceae bacterium]|nr:amidase [Rhodospirillaceae bacterium]